MRVCFPLPLVALDIIQLFNICQSDVHKTCIYIVTKFSPIFPFHPYLLFPHSGSGCSILTPSGKGCNGQKQKMGRRDECFLLAFEFQNPRLLEDQKGFIAQKMDFLGGNIMKRRGKAGISFGPGPVEQQGVSWVRRVLEGKFL